ncbi:MAG: glycine cleavage system protein GcvH [Chitinispirillaceae bacterium]|jgi:glycine cleavage system H protein|nr:glycine cleavage system protein GcvH [Chitinispirillaceae bacterium]
MTTPADRRYTKTHEWVKIEGDTAIVGITGHAQEALGDITFVELPKNGSAVTKDRPCGVIESVKAASDLNAPISGAVSAVNEALETAPEDINADPYGKGWMFKLTKFAAADAASLMDAAAYDAFAESEA